MKPFFVTLVLLWAVVCCFTAEAPLVRHSQQFVAIDGRPPSTSPIVPLRSESAADLIRLDVDVLLLSAGRIREALLNELGISDSGGRIRLVLYRATTPEDLITVVSTFSPGGWEYRVEVPDQVNALKLTRGVVNVLLLEMANRGQGPKQSDLPLWLVEGLTQHLLAVAGNDLVLGSVPVGSMLRVIRERKGLDYLQSAREVMARDGTMSFAQLAYPTERELSEVRLKLYQASAQLFVYELLHMPKGAANLVTLIRELAHCWNWETALVRAFSPGLQRMLDVEKKWSVDVLAFTARDPSQVLTKLRALEQLNTVLMVPAQIQVTRDQIPERRTVSLSEVLATWDRASQRSALRQRLGQLQLLRLTASPELVPLIDSYSHTISVYLTKLDLAGRSPENRMQGTVNASLAARDAIRTLEQLDQRREALRPEVATAVNSSTRR